MASVSLALMWHQHQPYYPDDVAGENPMPWVRLHGTKDYFGMALHLEEVPEFRCTINLVPSLLVQLEAYVDGRDRHAPPMSRRPGRRPGARRTPATCSTTSSWPSPTDDPAAPALPRAVHAARVVGRTRPTQALRRFRAARPARPAGLVEPGLDPPAALREGPRARRVQGQGPALHRGREAVAAGQAARAPGRRSSRCTASWPSAARSS